MARGSKGMRAGEDAGSEEPRVGFREILADPAVRVATLIVFVVMLGFGIIAPILPLYATSFGVGRAAAGLLISAFAFTRLFFDLVAGPLVDRWGERLTAAVGVSFVGVSTLLLGFAPNFTLAVVFRAAGGAGSAVFFAAVFSYLLRVIPRDRMGRSLSLFFGSFNVGIIAGGPIGGAVADITGSLRAPVFVYAGMLFVAGLLYLRFLKDPDRDADDPEEADALEGPTEGLWTRIGSLFRQRAFVTVVVVNLACLSVVGGVFDTLVPLFGDQGLGMSVLAIGAVFAVALAADLLALYPAGSLTDRVGRRPILLPALAAMLLCIPVVGLVGGPVAFGVVLALLGFASGAGGIIPPVMLSDLTDGRRTGLPVGVYRFFGDLGFVIGPLMAGLTSQAFGFKVAFAVAAVPVAVALAFALATPETMPRPAPDAVGEASGRPRPASTP